MGETSGWLTVCYARNITVVGMFSRAISLAKSDISVDTVPIWIK